MPRFITRWYWAFRILWQGISGRWYVFRDAPDWICAEWALFDDHEDADIRALARQAFEELELRLNRIRRVLDQAAADLDEFESTTPTQENP